MSQHEIEKAPKAKTTDKTPKFEFSGGDDYECNLDNEGFDPCDNPYAPGRLSRGKHSLKVRATETDGSVDGTPAKYSWKIVKKLAGSRPAQASRIQPRWYGRSVGFTSIGPAQAAQRSAAELRGRRVRVEERAVEAALRRIER